MTASLSIYLVSLSSHSISVSLPTGEWLGSVICRRRIKTKEKAKVVAAVWGEEIIKFLAALAELHQDDLKEKDVLQIVLGKTAGAARN